MGRGRPKWFWPGHWLTFSRLAAPWIRQCSRLGRRVLGSVKLGQRELSGSKLSRRELGELQTRIKDQGGSRLQREEAGGSWLWQEDIGCSRLERRNLGDSMLGQKALSVPRLGLRGLGGSRLGRRDSYGLLFCGWGRGCTNNPHYMERYAGGSRDIANSPYLPVFIDPIKYQARDWKRR